MGGGVPRVWSVAGEVDPLTGLASLDHVRAALGAALAEGRRLPLAVVVAELAGPSHRFEHARRLTVAGAMAGSAFGSALAVGRLGRDRVGVLSGPDPDLATRVALLRRMLADVPGGVHVVALAGSPEVADWTLRDLASARTRPSSPP
jgi:hypothetical protein